MVMRTIHRHTERDTERERERELNVEDGRRKWQALMRGGVTV